MTAMRTITVTQPEHIVAAAEVDVAAGFCVSIDEWIARRQADNGPSSELVQIVGARRAAVRAGALETFEVGDLPRRLSVLRKARAGA